MKHILKCTDCKKYTLKDHCPVCGKETLLPKPSKYSVEDRMGKYRRMAKKEELEKRGLI